jgi:DNA-binding CsgD family transcriptional regulator
MAMRFKGTDRKAVEKLVAQSKTVTDYARLYPSALRRTADIVTGIAADYEADGISVIFEVQDAPAERMERLQTAFALTASEAQLALHIADGGDLGSYAAAKGVTRNTARNQLQAVFDKTEARRQAELVKLLADF